MARLKDLIINIGANTKGLNKALGNTRREMSRTFGEIERAGKRMTVGVTAPLAAIGATSVRTFTTFEFAMAKVKAVSGATGEQFKALEGQAKKLGAQTMFTAQEVSTLQLELSRLGFDPEAIQKSTAQILALAQATDSDLGQAADVVGSTLRAFGMDIEQAGHLSDVMAASFSGSALSMDSFANAMQYVAPVSKAAGVSLEETTAMLAVLANNGIRGSKAGRALRRILGEMAATGKPAGEALKQLGSQGITLKDAFDEVGRSAQTQLLILAENADQLPELTRQFEQSDGAAQDMADTMADTTKGALEKMRSAVSGAQNALGEALAPAVVAVSEAVAEMAQQFTALSPSTQTAVAGIGLVAAAIGPLIVAAGTMIRSLGAIRGALKLVKTEMIATRVAALGPLAIGIAAAVGTIALFNHMAGEKVRKIQAIEDAAAAADRRFSAFVSSIEKGTGKMSDDALAKRIEELQAARDELQPDAVQITTAGGETVEQIRARMGVAPLHIPGQATQSLDAEGNLITKQATEESKELARITSELAILQNELTDRTNKKKAADKAAADAAKERARAEREAAEALRLQNQQASMAKSLQAAESLGLGPDQVSASGLLAHLGSDLSGPQGMTMAAPFMAMADDIEQAENRVNSSMDSMAAKAQQMQDAAIGLAGHFGAAMGALVSGSMEAGPALKAMAVQSIRAVIAMARANVIANATSPTAPANIFSGGLASPALIVAGLTMLEGFVGAIPALATGGLAHGPTMALVGDNPNAMSDPEVIAPLSKLRGMMGGQAVQVTGRIQGRDIVLAQERGRNQRSRSTGIR